MYSLSLNNLFFPHLQALTWAARQGHKNVVLKLLELGANKMIQTKDGKTPSEIAKRNKHLEVSLYIAFKLPHHKCLLFSKKINTLVN